MTNPTTLLRSVVIFSICVPLAIVLGYVLAGPFNYTFVGTLSVCLAILSLPLLLRFHHPLLLLGWNCTMIVFFLPGTPAVWLPLAAISLGLSVVRRTIDRDFRFVTVKSVNWPLVVLGAVVLVTAEATGGIKMRSLGGEASGGRQYILVLAAIAGYFALTAFSIPRDRALLYVGLFLLGGVTTIVGDVLYFQNPALQYIYWFFPPNLGALESRSGMVRLSGLNIACMQVAFFMLARYGIRNIFSMQTVGRCAVFIVLCCLSLLGGFRTNLVVLAMVFWLQFYLEGLHRTKLLPIILAGMALASTIAYPFTERLPQNVQRAVSFLPVKIDPMVRAGAESSTSWRITMWKALLPQVRQYFLFGKGYNLTREDLIFSVNNLMGTMQALSEEQSGSALVGNYHSGPLSVTIPFGVWGDIAFLWFLAASLRVLHRNYHYGDESLRGINRFLFGYFIVKVLMFFFIYGALFTDLQIFVGVIGVSVSLNGGMCRPAPEPARQSARGPTPVIAHPELQPAFQRSRSRRRGFPG